MWRGNRAGIQRARESFQTGWTPQFHFRGGIQAAREYVNRRKGVHGFLSLKHTNLLPNYPL